jgi:hypothetical protein
MRLLYDPEGDVLDVIFDERLHHAKKAALSQLSRSTIDEFLRKKLKRLESVFQNEFFPIIVTHMISQPDVEEFALTQGIKRVYYSYEFAR